MKQIIALIVVFFCFGFNAYSQNLDDYFKLAAENNPGLIAQYKNFEAALQKAAQIGSLQDPTLSFGYFISPVETRVGPQIAKFSLAQMFPWFGTLRAQSDATSLLAEAKYQEFLDARNKLYFNVSAAYYPLYDLREQIEIETENLSLLNAYKAIAMSKFENGKGAMVDVLRADIMLKDAETNLSILSQKEKPLLSRFNALLNRSEDEAVFMPKELQIDIPLLAYSKDSVLNNNPILDELDAKINASAAMERTAIKQGLPKIGVGLDYVVVGQRSDLTFDGNGKDALMPMVSVSLPIFRSKYKAARREAQLTQESFMLQKSDATNQLSSSYDLIRYKIQSQAELLLLFNAQIKSAEQSLNLLYSLYSNSGKDFEEVLRMQQQVLKYEKLKAAAITEYNIALAELDYITAKTK